MIDPNGIDITGYQKLQLKYKGKLILPRTSIECVYDPATGMPIDLSKFATSGDSGKTFTINNNSADSNGNFTITAEGIGAAAVDHTHSLASLGAAASDHSHTLSSLGAAAADHTHTLSSLGAAAAGHGHEISDINGLEARLLGLDVGGSEVEGGFAMEPLNNNSYPEPSTWSNPYDEPGE